MYARITDLQVVPDNLPGFRDTDGIFHLYQHTPVYEIRNIRYEAGRAAVTGCLYRDQQLVVYDTIDALVEIVKTSTQPN